MEVSENGDTANWKIPGKMVKGMRDNGFGCSENIIVEDATNRRERVKY